MAPAFLLLFLALNLFAVLGAPNNISTECLPRFRTEPRHFAPCKDNVCLLFISEKPFVDLDPRIPKENNQTVFRCKDRRAYFPHLKGIIFGVKDAIVPLQNAFCVYGGNECTFNGMLDFISRHSTPEAKYRFGVTGIAFLLPDRIRPSLKPTVPIMNGKMVVIGPRTPAPKRKDAIMSIVLPFELSAWLSILAVALCFLLLWVLTACAFTRCCSLRSVLQLTVGEYNAALPLPSEKQGDNPALSGLQENFRLSNKLAVQVLRSSFKVFLATTIIFYEVAIVYHIFEQHSKTVTIDVHGLTKTDLSKYIVTKDGAMELVFRNAVDPEGKYNTTTKPWHNCRILDDCYDMIRNKSHEGKMLVTHDFAVRYHLHKIRACDSLAVYDTKSPLYSFNAGLYLNSNVPEEDRNKIDRSILKLRLDDKVRRLMAEVVDDSKQLHCGTQRPRIDGLFLGSLFAFVLGPLVIIVLLTLAWGCINHLAASKLDSQAKETEYKV